MTEQYKSRTEKRLAKQKAKGEKNKKPKRKKILMGIAIFFIVAFIGGVSTVAYMISGAPDINEEALRDPLSSKIYDANGELIIELGAQKRDYVEYDEIPELVKNAILATEDVRFFKHNGIDIIRIGGAILSNVKDGFGSQGASTLTQQVVKNSFLSPEKTLKRKVQEAWLAFRLEQKYSKEEIFEMYVNKIHMGGSVYGIKSAAKTYFGKELDELELHEAALIAGLPQSPNGYHPFYYPDAAEERRNTVLSLMHQHGFITKEEMDKAKKIPVESSLVKESERQTDEFLYDSFIQQVEREVKKIGDYNLYTDGLEIYTSLDSKTQEYLFELLNSSDAIPFPDDEMQAAVVLVDTKTGEIRAIAGGRKRDVLRGTDFSVEARQPGSTIKPILDYGPAIEYLNWSTYQILEDKPYKYSNGTPVYNWNRQYAGPVTMREALRWSLNIPAIQAIQAVGLEKAREFAVKLGIPLEEQIYEPYAIGGMSKGISPLDLAGAYSAFGNNGIYTEPHAVTKIVLQDGETEIKTKPDSKVVMKDSTAYMITDMLKTVVTSGTGTMANVSGVPIAGKTGTTNYTDEEYKNYNINPNQNAVPDSWFAGYSTNYTAAIWAGYKDRSTPVIGSAQKIPQQIFKQLMTFVHQGKETTDFKQPRSVVKVGVEKGTNPPKLASEFTPKSEIIYELFVKGFEPKEISDKYDKLEAPSNLTAKYNKNKNEITLSWKKPKTDKKISFEVSVILNDGKETVLQTTDKDGLIVENIIPGMKYTFKVVAIFEELRSDAATTTIEIPSEDQNHPKPPGKNNGNGNGPGDNNGNGNNRGDDNSGESDNEDEENEDQEDEDDGFGFP